MRGKRDHNRSPGLILDWQEKEEGEVLPDEVTPKTYNTAPNITKCFVAYHFEDECLLQDWFKKPCYNETTNSKDGLSVLLVAYYRSSSCMGMAEGVNSDTN